MPSSQPHAINGNPAALLFDRAVDELRRGRAIQLQQQDRGLIVAAVETEVGFAGVFVGPVAGEAAVRKQWADVAIEFKLC